MGFIDSLRMYKNMLIACWNAGAERGKELQESHSQKIKRRKDDE